jgi:hypothetical protein
MCCSTSSAQFASPQTFAPINRMSFHTAAFVLSDEFSAITTSNDILGTLSASAAPPLSSSSSAFWVASQAYNCYDATKDTSNGECGIRPRGMLLEHIARWA